MGRNFFAVARLVVLFRFWQATEGGGAPIYGYEVVTEFRHFFKCALYYDISCRTIFLYVNKFLCNITQFANVKRKVDRLREGGVDAKRQAGGCGRIIIV